MFQGYFPPKFSHFIEGDKKAEIVKEYPDKYRFHIISEFSDHTFLLIIFDNLSSSNTTDFLQLNNNAQSTIITVSCVKKIRTYFCRYKAHELINTEIYTDSTNTHIWKINMSGNL